MPQKPHFELPPINPDAAPLGVQIAAMRKVRGLSQKELAARIGVKQALMSDYERGRLRISAEMLGHIAIQLGTSTDALLGIKEMASRDVGIPEPLRQRLEKLKELPPSKSRVVIKSIEMMLDGILANPNT